MFGCVVLLNIKVKFIKIIYEYIFLINFIIICRFKDNFDENKDFRKKVSLRLECLSLKDWNVLWNYDIWCFECFSVNG